MVLTHEIVNILLRECDARCWSFVGNLGNLFLLRCKYTFQVSVLYQCVSLYNVSLGALTNKRHFQTLCCDCATSLHLISVLPVELFTVITVRAEL